MNAVVSDPFDLLRRGYDAYLAQFRAGSLEPEDPYLPFDFTRFLQHQWRLFGGAFVQGQLHEMTNVLNDWHQRLNKWHAWNGILPNFSELDAWALRKEFLEADAHLCLISPSALRDKLTFVATNGIHQARLASDKSYRDELKGDPKKPGGKAKQFPRQENEQRLEALLSPWANGQQFMGLLRGLDDKAYRDATLDYRNEHSHALGPNLEIGETRFVTRRVRQATELVADQHGRLHHQPIPDRMSVSYGFGPRPPLDSEAARQASLSQFRIARKCFETYVAILDVVRQHLPSTESKPT